MERRLGMSQGQTVKTVLFNKRVGFGLGQVCWAWGGNGPVFMFYLDLDFGF